MVTWATWHSWFIAIINTIEWVIWCRDHSWAAWVQGVPRFSRVWTSERRQSVGRRSFGTTCSLKELGTTSLSMPPARSYTALSGVSKRVGHRHRPKAASYKKDGIRTERHSSHSSLITHILSGIINIYYKDNLGCACYWPKLSVHQCPLTECEYESYIWC